MARGQLHVVWLYARGWSTVRVVGATGYCERWCRTVLRRYAREGPDALGDRRRANPGAAPLLDAAAQADLRAALASPATGGGLWTGKQVAAWMAARLDRPVPPQRGLRRLVFTPRRPRPRETRADAAAQAAFKKGGSPAR